jgi:hypothetical protein
MTILILLIVSLLRPWTGERVSRVQERAIELRHVRSVPRGQRSDFLRGTAPTDPGTLAECDRWRREACRDRHHAPTLGLIASSRVSIPRRHRLSLDAKYLGTRVPWPHSLPPYEAIAPPSRSAQ